MSEWILLLSLFLVLMNGFFVAAEFGMVKVRPSYVEELVQKGNKRAKIVRTFIGKLDVFLSATQIGITLASLAFGWIAEPYFAGLFIKVFHEFTDLSKPEYKVILETFSFTFAFLVISATHMTFGEIAPKNLSIQKAESVAFFVAYPMLFFYYLFYPFVRFFNATANFALKIAGIDKNNEFEKSFSDRELTIILTSLVKKGHYSIDKKQLIENAFKFHKKRIEQIMVPRNEIFYISLDSPIDKILEDVKESNYTRIPIVNNNSLDEILGIVNFKDILWALYEGDNTIDLKSLARDILYVPEAQSIHALLQEFQKNKLHMAVVVNEYGTTSGLVTIEDVMEEIVGEIQDEHDEEVDKFIFHEDGNIEIDGLVLIDDIVERLKINNIKPIANTIGGYVLNSLGRMPRIGDKVIIDDYQIIVADIERFRVSRVIIKKIVV